MSLLSAHRAVFSTEREADRHIQSIKQEVSLIVFGHHRDHPFQWSIRLCPVLFFDYFVCRLLRLCIVKRDLVVLLCMPPSSSKVGVKIGPLSEVR